MTKLDPKGIEKAAEVVYQEIGDHMSDWFSRKVARLTITAYLNAIQSAPTPSGWRPPLEDWYRLKVVREGDLEVHAGVPSDAPLFIQERDRLRAGGVIPPANAAAPESPGKQMSHNDEVKVEPK